MELFWFSCTWSLKDAIKKVDSDDDDDDDDVDAGGLFNKKEKTSEEKAQEEADYIEWLKGKRQQLSNPDDQKSLVNIHPYAYICFPFIVSSFCSQHEM